MPLVSFAEFGVDDKELYATYLKAHTPVYTGLCEQSEASYIAYLRGFGGNGCCNGFDSEDNSDRAVCGRCTAGGGGSGAGSFGCFAGCRGRFANAVERLLAGGNVGAGNDGIGSGRERSVGAGVSVGESIAQSGDVEVRSEVSVVEENGDAGRQRCIVSGAGGNASGVLDEVVRVRGQCAGDFGSVSGRGKNFLRNKKKRERAKAGGSGLVEKLSGDREKSDLQKSLEEKWKIENELKILKAKKEVELLKSEDLSEVKKLRDRKLRSANEKTMVQIEKAHASLSNSDNVGGQRSGFCYTVVDGEVVDDVPALSGGECSISPSSSVSEREVRAMAKELADVKLELEKKNKRIKRLEDAAAVGTAGNEIAVTVKDGDVAPSAASAFDLVCGKNMWEATGDLDLDPDTLYVKCVDNLMLGGYDYSY